MSCLRTKNRIKRNRKFLFFEPKQKKIKNRRRIFFPDKKWERNKNRKKVAVGLLVELTFLQTSTFLSSHLNPRFTQRWLGLLFFCQRLCHGRDSNPLQYSCTDLTRDLLKDALPIEATATTETCIKNSPFY